MSDTSPEECCSDSNVITAEDLEEGEDVFDIKIVFVIFLSVIFVKIFDYISDKVNINFIAIMGNLFSRLTGNCSNPEEDNTSLVPRTKAEPNTGNQVNVPEIRKHSSTPLPLDRQQELTPKQLQKKSAKQLSSSAPAVIKPLDKKSVKKDKELDKKPVFTTTFEAQVDAAPPHPLEERFQDIQLDEVEIDTNLFTPEVEDAVVKIQAGVRGYLARKHVNELKKDIEDSLLIDVEEVPVVPPPKNFENQTLSVSNEFDKWKRLSDHLEDKIIDIIDNEPTKPVEESQLKSSLNGRTPITEAVIPLKDSDDNKVIETYVCKENILDVEPNEEQQTPVHRLNKNDEKVVEKVFSVLMSETESEEIMNFVEPVSKDVVNTLINDRTAEETPESEVLANLNAILDNNDTTPEELVKQESIEEKVAEMVSQNTTQEIIRNSFHEFVKEMTQPSEETPIEENRKTDSMIFEEEVVQSVFGKEVAKSQSQNQIFAIEVFKTDVNEKQLANVTTLCEPEPTVRNMWGVEEKVCKSSVDQFVVKAVEPPAPIIPSTEVEEEEEVFSAVLETPPLLETVQKIEINSRKNSEDLLESDVTTAEEIVVETTEVLPSPSPIIQIEESEQNGRPLDEEEAAIRIQAAFRGYQIRRSLSREASPNRGPNHNNIDSNNNNHNNDIDFNDNDVQWVESGLQPTANQLSTDFNHHFSDTTQVQNDINNRVMSGSTELINTSLQRLEDQLMQELISSSAEEEERTRALLNDNLETNQRLSDELDLSSGELTAPLLLQRLQQSMNMSPSNVKQEGVVQTSPESVPFDAQTEQSELVEDRPLIEKSDTVIDLMSTSPQRLINQIIDNNESNLIEIEDNIIADQMTNSQHLREVLNRSPIIVSEILKEVKTEESLESVPLVEPKALKEVVVEQIERRIPEPQPEVEAISNQSEPQPLVENIESLKPDLNGVPTETKPTFEAVLEPPTPVLKEITPELSFIESSPEGAVLTKVCSSESEQESELMSSDKLVESRPSMIPVLESNNMGPKTGEQKDIFKRPKPILKDKVESRFNVIPDEQTHSTSEEISSPDDDNPEFVGLGPNTPIPVRASSPNPFGKKRRRGKKGTAARK